MDRQTIMPPPPCPTRFCPGRAPNANVLDAPCEPVGSLLCQVALERCLATAVICKDRSNNKHHQT